MIPHFVIACNELPDRTQACRDHLQERGVPAVFWRGFHGATWGVETRMEFDPGRRLSPGHVGLNMGTWALWQHVLLSCPNQVATTVPSEGGRYGQSVADDDEYVFLEDDVELLHNYPAVLSDLRIQLHYDLPDWDLIFLGLAECEPQVWNKVTERIGGPRSNLCKMSYPFGTHAYMVRRRALPILLDHMRAAEKNLDQQLFERVLRPGLLKWAACVPALVKQRTFDYSGVGKPEWAPSTIDNAVGERHFDAVMPPNMSAYKLDEQDVKRLSGASPLEVPIAQSPEVIAATARLVDPFPCAFRGEHLNKLGLTRAGRTVPLNECARTRLPCHTQVGEGDMPPDVVACETCTLRTSMPSRATRDKLPLPDGHFNPSMIVYDGKLILATRDSWGHSKVALWELKNTKTDWTGDWSADPIGSFGSDHQQAPRLEDPRLFIFRGRLCAQFNLPDGYPPKLVQVGYCRFAKDLSRIEYTEVYKSPNGNLYEKNWSPIVHEDELHWGYATKPKHVVIGEQNTHTTDNKLPWTGGVVRGGATPVLVRYGNPFVPNNFDDDFLQPVENPVYYHFFHGCLKRLMGNVYTMGCIVFSAEPPFRVLRQTATPLLWPDLPGPGESVVKRYVVWPGGAVPHAGAWHIALGIDDTFCRILRLPFADVESALTDVPESGSVTSIRDTPIALGTGAGGK